MCIQESVVERRIARVPHNDSGIQVWEIVWASDGFYGRVTVNEDAMNPRQRQEYEFMQEELMPLEGLMPGHSPVFPTRELVHQWICIEDEEQSMAEELVAFNDADYTTEILSGLEKRRAALEAQMVRWVELH